VFDDALLAYRFLSLDFGLRGLSRHAGSFSRLALSVLQSEADPPFLTRPSTACAGFPVRASCCVSAALWLPASRVMCIGSGHTFVFVP